MRAVAIMVHAGPEALEVIDLSEVHAGPGQVRIRMHAASSLRIPAINQISSRASFVAPRL
jgi:NADPH:quinone reductase-like Zn-dependent oxidoreductase